MQKQTITSRKKKTAYWCITIFFAVYSAMLIFPFVWAIVNSLKDGREFFENGPFAFPEKLLFKNYLLAFSEIKVAKTGLFGMFFNSIVYTAGSTAVSVFVCTMTAYIITKFKFFGRNFLSVLAIFLMIIPIVGALPAQYKLISSLGLKNNLFGMMLTYTGGFGFNYFILCGTFRSISWSYAEAAEIDGAGDYTIFFKIMLPQAKPAMLALAIITAIGIWNDYYTPLLYLPKTPTLAYGLYAFESMIIYGGANYPIYFAAILMSLVPVLIIFILFQKPIMENMVAGGLKG